MSKRRARRGASTVILALTLPEELHWALKAHADARGIPLDALILAWLPAFPPKAKP